ncbi:FAD/NAD(P)-binding domain-containing protein [Mycena galericulata]|nr:FAD/NAD(P)-binding domain-containing protein [Mycena galericulata]
MSNKQIVIVGAGTAGGSKIARTLSSKLPTAHITLVNPLPYAISRPTLPRMTVSDATDLAETALIPLDRLFSNANGSFVEGVVTRIEPQAGKTGPGGGGAVGLADGRRLEYDVLVLAPGSIWEGPLDFPDDREQVHAFIDASRAKFKKAQKIVLVGGGAVGVEYAGEIKDIWPDKDVTIIHGDSGLMNSTYPAGFRTGLEKGLRARGVKIILNDHVDEIPWTEPGPGPVTLTTRNGTAIPADLVVPTRGPRPRTAFVAASLGPSAIDAQQQIKVAPTLQLPAYPDIFALGDAIDTVEQKQVGKASAHALLVSANVAAYLTGRALRPYAGSREMIVVTNGANGGRAYLGILWGIILGDWFARLTKSRGLMVASVRRHMGY